jgi:hypothetical protein
VGRDAKRRRCRSSKMHGETTSEREAAMHNLTGTFFALVMAGAVIVGCSTQQASTPQTSTASTAAPGAPIEFRVVPERNPANCRRFDAALSRVHTFRATGDAASVTSSGGITSNMTQTSPGIYTTDFSLGGTTLRVVANAASSPKSLTVTEPRLGCRWSAVAP